MNIDGNVEALNCYEKEVDQVELQAERERENFRNNMDDVIANLAWHFKEQAKISNLCYDELKAIMLEDLEAQI